MESSTVPGLSSRELDIAASADWVRAWIAADEGQQVEFKLENETQPDIAETLAAFANAEGGVILFGVTDDCVVQGVGNSKALTLRVWAAARSVNPRLDNEIKVEEIVVTGKRVLVVRIPDRLQEIYGAGPIYRIRQGASNVIMSAQLIVQHALNRGAVPYDRQSLAGTSLASLDRSQLESFLTRRGGASGLDSKLRNLGVLAEDGAVTVAGMLMFGRDPLASLPQAVLQCARFAGTGVARFLDRVEISGPVPQLVEEGMVFFNRHIRHGTVIRGIRHVDVDEYPTAALREALINALCHRDYSRAGTAVNISIYDDRIEIINPGGLLPGLRPDSLEGAHQLRNETLGRLMHDAGLIERWGSGITRMRQSMQAADLQAPRIQTDRDWFQIVFVGPGANFLRAPAERQPTVAPAPEILRRPQLNERQQTLLSTLKPGEQVSQKQYAARFEVSERTASRDLGELVSWGLLSRKGETKAARYMLTPAAGGKGEAI